ncbi:hypothetical protein DUI87_23016 [Hirundo rustica rustica]|uniref:Uncharacterized protein n=1 Tax=Hirundo rustica rustica TaxID=333673 RepID=A0A3M0JGZ3_HIRRU|nr:hypothetical protein DUI87_23016 [Hirundo rustica rustica]
MGPAPGGKSHGGAGASSLWHRRVIGKGLQQAEQDLRIKAVAPNLVPESRLCYFCHRQLSSFRGESYNWRATCGSKPQKVPKKLEEPLGEHVAEEFHAETDPSGLVFAVESPKHRILQARAAVFSLGLKNPIGVLQRSPPYSKQLRRVTTCSWKTNPGDRD